MPSPPKEKRIQDAIATELAKIGVVVPLNWLTAPSFVIASPLVNVNPGVNPQLFLQYVNTAPSPPEAGTATHSFRATWHAWMVSTKVDDLTAASFQVLDLKADVLRALFAGEGAITTAGATAGVWPGVHEMRPDLAQAGCAVGVLEIFADFTIDHTDS